VHIDVKPTISVNNTVAEVYIFGGTTTPLFSIAATVGGTI
jgi:hypothetical protein